MKKQAQEDDFGQDFEGPEYDEGDDLKNWEDEQVFQDTQQEMQSENPLTNMGDPVLTLDQLSAMDNNQFAEELLNWHGGGGSGIYAVGSTMLAGKEPDPLEVKRAINELEETGGEGYEDGDLMEMNNFAQALKERFNMNEPDDSAMHDMENDDPMMYEDQQNWDADDHERMANWVRKNCKFAMENIPLTKTDPFTEEQVPFSDEEQTLRNIAQDIINWAKEEAKRGTPIAAFSPHNVDPIVYKMLKNEDPGHPAIADKSLRDPVVNEILTTLDALRESESDPIVRY